MDVATESSLGAKGEGKEQGNGASKEGNVFEGKAPQHLRRTSGISPGKPFLNNLPPLLMQVALYMI